MPVAAQMVTDYEVITAPALVAPKAERAVLTEIAVAGERLVAVGDYGLILTRDQNIFPSQHVTNRLPFSNTF
ncbi:BNR domain-containing protein, partial [Pseudidiomarina aestuarii]